MLFFISGITGHVGGAAARKLLAQGHSLRTLARSPEKAADWAAQGVEVRAGEWQDATTLKQALEGVDGAYVMMPPTQTPSHGFPEATIVAQSIAEAVGAVKVRRVAVLSSIGSELSHGLGLITSTHILETELRKTGQPLGIVRAGGFFENFVSAIASVKDTGTFWTMYQPIGQPVPMIASEDIGNEVAKLLSAEIFAPQIVELGTPYTPEKIAQAMAQALGRDVEAQPVPRDQWSATLQRFGLPAQFTWAFEEMIDGFNSGHIHFGVAGTVPVAATITPAEFYSQIVRSNENDQDAR